eukprot:SAG11_NODE_18_length_25850_cov_18.210050_14_plen_41_part_00
MPPGKIKCVCFFISLIMIPVLVRYRYLGGKIIGFLGDIYH